MLKHETLVLTLAAVEEIEKKLLSQMNRVDRMEPRFNAREALHFSQPNAITNYRPEKFDTASDEQVSQQ